METTLRDLHENLGWIIGSAIAGIATFLSLMWESGLLSTLIGIIIGAGIAYFVQTRTQKRAWKREYSVKIAEEVYGSLFKGIKDIIQSLENRGYWYIGFGVWREMQDDHRYFMVEEGFRAKLDEFCGRLEKYSRTVVEVRGQILPKIVMEETESVLRVKTDHIPTVFVAYKKGRVPVSANANLIDCLISETHPITYATRHETNASTASFRFEIRPIAESSSTKYDNEARLNKIWQSALRRTREDESYKFIVDENDRLLEEARKLKQEVADRIEEPWKI